MESLVKESKEGSRQSLERCIHQNSSRRATRVQAGSISLPTAGKRVSLFKDFFNVALVAIIHRKRLRKMAILSKNRIHSEVVKGIFLLKKKPNPNYVYST
jgi:hypothetical protein